MIKRITIILAICLLATSFLSYASSMTALDYATISQRDSNSGKSSDPMKNKQKALDKFSGPGAIESTGNYVANPDTTEYFAETVAAEQLSEFVEAVDPRYGITFRSKRHFKTNQGEFNLLSATFEPVTNDSYSDYKFKLSLEKVNQRVKFPYLVYIKAYNTAGVFVDFSYTMFDDSAVFERTVSLPLYKNNERHVARIEFSLDTTGIDPATVAKNTTSQLCFGYPDLFERLADPNAGYTEERKAQLLETYYKEYDQHYKWAEQDATRQNDIYEIQ